jgi:hypothetical protein
VPEVKEHEDARVNSINFAVFLIGITLMLIIKLALEP